MTNWTDKAISFDDVKQSAFTDKWNRPRVRDTQRAKCYDVEDQAVAVLVHKLANGESLDSAVSEIGTAATGGESTWGIQAPRVKGTAAIREWIEARLNSPSWQAAFPNACRDLLAQLEIELGRSASCTLSGRTIQLIDHRQLGVPEYVIRHELSHALNARELIAAGIQSKNVSLRNDGSDDAEVVAGHGPEFVGTLIKTIELDYGTEAAALAADYFTAAKVKFTDGQVPGAPAQEIAPPLAAKPSSKPSQPATDTGSSNQLQLDI